MTREEGKEVTLKRIRQAIAKLLKSKGYENIKVREICKEANISIGTFYNYFDSKDAIIEDTINLGFYVRRVNAKPEIQNDDVLETLLQYIETQVGYIETLSIPMMVEVFRMFLYRNGHLLLEPNTTGYQAVQELVKEGQEKGQISKKLTDKEMAECLIKMMIGNCYSWCLLNGNYNIRVTVSKEARRLLEP